MERYLALIENYLDEELEAAEAAALENWLLQGVDHRRLFAQRVFEHRSMLDALHGQAAVVLAGEASQADPAQADVELPYRNAAWSMLRDFATNYMVLSSLVSGLVITIILLSLALWIVPDGRRAAPVDRTPSIEFVARISNTSQAAFDKDSDGNFKNVDLFEDERLVLASGLVEVTFGNGAVTLLEGPCQFVVSSSSSGSLERGKLIAQVSEQAVGFAVDTPLGRMVDLGTEFGLEVSEQDDTSLAVFAGAVEVQFSGQSGGPLHRRVEAGSALHLRRGLAGGVDVVPSVADAKQFTRAIQSRQEKLAAARPGDLLFADSFDVAADRNSVNPSRTDQPLRQRGPLAPLYYKLLATGRLETADDGGHLLLGDGLAMGSNAIGLLHNFVDPAILAAGGIVVEFDVDPVIDSSGGSSDWAAVTLFDTNEQQLAGATPLVLSRVALLLRDNGVCVLYDRGSRVLEKKVWAVGERSGLHHIRIEVEIKRFDGQSPATIRAFADGAAEPFVTHTTKGGFDSNYISWEARNQVAKFDNLRISLIESVDSPP